jgi:hypothetical protein
MFVVGGHRRFFLLLEEDSFLLTEISVKGMQVKLFVLVFMLRLLSLERKITLQIAHFFVWSELHEICCKIG